MSKFYTIPTPVINHRYYKDMGDNKENLVIVNAIIWPENDIFPKTNFINVPAEDCSDSIVTSDTNVIGNPLFRSIQKLDHGDIIENEDQTGDKGNGLYQIITDENGINLISEFAFNSSIDEYGNVLPIGNILDYNLIGGRTRETLLPISVLKLLKTMNVSKPYKIDTQEDDHGLIVDIDEKSYKINILEYPIPQMTQLKNRLCEMEHLRDEYKIEDPDEEKLIDNVLNELFFIFNEYFLHCYIYLDGYTDHSGLWEVPQYCSDILTPVTMTYNEETNLFDVYTIPLMYKTFRNYLKEKIVPNKKAYLSSIKKQNYIPSEIDFMSYLSI